MKFHCDRCKTRYSIADERVRGKILKIRCKNCSAVITVREGMAEPAPEPVARPRRDSGSQSALRSAFDAEIRRPAEPSASDSFAAPAHIEEEWYVSLDGEQSGPFGLEAARDWIAKHPPEAELYCWSEGFDDWLPVDKVAHFRGLRQRPDTVPASPPRPAPRTPTAPPPVPMSARRAEPSPPEPQAEPENLFAAAMARAEARARDAAPAPTNGASAHPRPGATEPEPDAADPYDDDDAAAGSLDFDIGEASRVVNLADMLAPAARRSTGSLPGTDRLGKGTGSAHSISTTQETQRPMAPLSDDAVAGARPGILSQPRRERPMWFLPALLLVGALVMVGGVTLLFTLVSGDGDAGSTRLSGGGLSSERLAELGYRFENPNERDEQPGGKVDVSQPADSTGGTQARGGGTRKVVTPKTGQNPTNTGPNIVVPDGPGANPDLEPLRPEDVIRVSSQQSIGTKRCYERALKADPFLEVTNIRAKLTIDPSGVVSNVELGNQSGSELGQCLKSRIRKWPFRKSRDGITTEIRLVFEQR